MLKKFFNSSFGDLALNWIDYKNNRMQQVSSCAITFNSFSTLSFWTIDILLKTKLLLLNGAITKSFLPFSFPTTTTIQEDLLQNETKMRAANFRERARHKNAWKTCSHKLNNFTYYYYTHTQPSHSTWHFVEQLCCPSCLCSKI